MVYDALVNVAGAPDNDKFMIISEHGPGSFVMDPNYVVARSERALIISRCPLPPGDPSGEGLGDPSGEGSGG